MLTVRAMTAQDEAYVMPLVEQFYHSEAVDHAVSMEILQQTFAQAVSDNPLLEGFVLQDDGKSVGYAYITHMYAAEAGPCVMIEELMIEPGSQGRGLGHAFFAWLFAAYPGTARFRLEVTRGNARARALYEQLGFQTLGYDQMIRGR
ncbi:MAG: GNAT family N-acetyltransferase [Eubacteriales bacterium]|nr:GNAT family N-acetyltransferase [Eubacteriales bacterium]